MTELVPPALADALATRYAIEREIGRGGMARVYLAYDVRHRRQVALKVLPPDIANAISKQRFLREIEIAARLTHPNILPLHDSGEAAGRLYYVMPFVEGRSLRDLLAEAGQLPTDQALAITTAVADALDYAHAHGVVHRDIKPENILLVAGHPVVGDFGIACAMHAATTDRLTSGFVAVGTPTYMSPEQAAPAAVVDGRADIYSLALVCYELLTGTLPVTLSALSPRHTRTSLLRVRRTSEASDVPAHVQRALRRALAIDPAARFPRAGEFALALRRPSSRWARIGAGVAAALSVLALGVVGWDMRRPALPYKVALSPHRVAVARFENGRHDPELAYLGVMAADWITEGLERTGIVDVVPTPTALQAWHFADSLRRTPVGADPVRTLAEETNAGVVITGSYYREHNEIQILVQVTDAANSKLLGAFGPVRGTLSSPTSAIEDVRSRVMGLLSSTLDARLAASIAIPMQPPTFEAYREFSEGLESYLSNDFQAAASHFVGAYQHDTAFVTSLLMGSISYSNQQNYARADSLLNLAAGNRSQLSSYSRDWFDYRRAVLHGDRPAALAAVRALAAAAPGTKASYNLAVEALQNGSLIEASRTLDSLPPDRGAMRGWAPYWDARTSVEHLLGEYPRELNDAERAHGLFPNRIYLLGGAVRADAALGRSADVEQLLDSAERMPTDPLGISAGDLMLEAGLELEAHGHHEPARAVLARAERFYERPDAAGSTSARFARAQTLYALARYREALLATDSLLANDPKRVDYLGLVGAAAARSGDVGRARAVARELEQLPRRYDLGVITFNEARVTAALGMRDSAVALLRRSLHEGHEYDLWVHRDVDFAALRGFPPYDELVRPKVH